MQNPSSRRETIATATNLRVGAKNPISIEIPDFTIQAGDFVAITGANGCGKTTLLKTIARLLNPIAGKLELAIRPGAAIGYLPQQGPLQKDFPASVFEVVISGCQASRGIRPFYTFSERRRAERIMERLGIATLSSKSYKELSGGQRQRALIARALISPRKLVLLDEPTASLDLQAAKSFLELAKELNSKGATFVFVTHDPLLIPAATKTIHIGEAVLCEKCGEKTEVCNG
ncbi:MAG: ATP-binding cassette domain-containing protein [Kiritimatiellae bacterium]|nr:ATP-binding cassette domain-containing protein [Kiritimatiellia bacterium]